MSLDILRYDFLVIVDFFLNWRLKQFQWIKRGPLLVASWKVLADQMPGNAREGDIAVAPRRAKCVVKDVVLKVWITLNTLLHQY